MITMHANHTFALEEVARKLGRIRHTEANEEPLDARKHQWVCMPLNRRRHDMTVDVVDTTTPPGSENLYIICRLKHI